MTVASAQAYPQRAVKFILPFGPAAGAGGKARSALGQAGGRREPTGRRRPRRHHRIHQCERRSHALVRSGFDLHGSPIYERKTTLRCGARLAADHERHDHCDWACGTGISEREDARRIHCARPREARYAQRGGRRRQFRPDLVGFHQNPAPTGGPACHTATSSKHRATWPKHASTFSCHPTRACFR